MKKLTICIPTYNRSDFVISQLKFLKKEIQTFHEIINIIVADNCSENEHHIKLIEYHKENNFFELKLNKSNLGSIGNIYYLLGLVQSEFVWFVSDDDILLEGICERLIKILKSKKYLPYIFLNYEAFYKDPSIIHYRVNLLNYSGIVDDGMKCLTDLFTINGAISMFITSCIYSTSELKKYFFEREIKNLVDPLLFSFMLSRGSVYIEKDIFILERCDNPSWSNEGTAIFSWQIQTGLIELLDHGYPKKFVIKMLVSSYSIFKNRYLKMLIHAPINDRNKIIFILGLNNFILLPKSIFDILKRKISIFYKLRSKLFILNTIL